MRYHHKASLLPTISVALVVMAMIVLAFNFASADTGAGGEINGGAVEEQRPGEEQTPSEQEQTPSEEEQKPTEPGAEEQPSTGEEEGGETTEDESATTPWYKKYWWILICPAALLFFGAGVGVYYLVNWIRRKK